MIIDTQESSTTVLIYPDVTTTQLRNLPTAGRRFDLPASLYLQLLTRAAAAENTSLAEAASGGAATTITIDASTLIQIRATQHLIVMKRLPETTERRFNGSPCSLPPRWWWAKYHPTQREAMALMYFFVEHPDRKLSAWPYANVHGDGHVCWGANTVAANSSIEEIDRAFFSTPFNNDLVNRARPRQFNFAADIALLIGKIDSPLDVFNETTLSGRGALYATHLVATGQPAPNTDDAEEVEDEPEEEEEEAEEPPPDND